MKALSMTYLMLIARDICVIRESLYRVAQQKAEEDLKKLAANLKIGDCNLQC